MTRKWASLGREVLFVGILAALAIGSGAVSIPADTVLVMAVAQQQFGEAPLRTLVLVPT